jgi:fructose PTS system EIIBC or EIIC component
MKLLGITSCPNGIALTYMAAERLKKAARALGVEMKIETQGSAGTENELAEAEITDADGIIIAADKNIDKSRFGGKRLIETTVMEGIRNPEKLIREFMDK